MVYRLAICERSFIAEYVIPSKPCEEKRDKARHHMLDSYLLAFCNVVKRLCPALKIGKKRLMSLYNFVGLPTSHKISHKHFFDDLLL